MVVTGLTGVVVDLALVSPKPLGKSQLGIELSSEDDLVPSVASAGLKVLATSHQFSTFLLQRKHIMCCTRKTVCSSLK